MSDTFLSVKMSVRKNTLNKKRTIKGILRGKYIRKSTDILILCFISPYFGYSFIFLVKYNF